MFTNPFSFTGRIRRMEFGISLIIYYAVYFCAALFMGASPEIGSIVMILLMIPLVWFMLAQAAKRCHDLDKSGWWQLLPIFNPFFLLFSDGDHRRNEYGPSPKNPDQVEDILASETLDGHMRGK